MQNVHVHGYVCIPVYTWKRLPLPLWWTWSVYCPWALSQETIETSLLPDPSCIERVWLQFTTLEGGTTGIRLISGLIRGAYPIFCPPWCTQPLSPVLFCECTSVHQQPGLPVQWGLEEEEKDMKGRRRRKGKRVSPHNESRSYLHCQFLTLSVNYQLLTCNL